MGGAILCSQAFYEEHLEHYIRHLGPSISPYNAWSLAKSMETLDLRVRSMCDHALSVAKALAESCAVERVLYPGLASHPQHQIAAKQMLNGGSLLAFEVKETWRALRR